MPVTENLLETAVSTAGNSPAVPEGASAAGMTGQGRVPDEVKLGLLILSIFTVAIIAFWPLMTVFIWAVAIAVVLLPVHTRLCRIVAPAASATFITVWVILIILLVMSFAVSMMIGNVENIGTMTKAMVTGLDRTVFAGFVPSFTEQELLHFDKTLTDLIIEVILDLTGNILQSLLSIIIFFLTLSMLLYYGEAIWCTMTGPLSTRLRDPVNRLAEISENTIYALIIVQISAAIISFILAILFFTLLGRGEVLLFSTMIGFAMLIPLIGAQAMILILALYFLSTGDSGAAVLMLLVGYPLLSGWIDFFYRPVMMGRRVSVHPVIMMIGIFAGVPFMGIVGFILGPVLIALVVVGATILSQEFGGSGPATP
jgi:predicted PurR-regulated permease PerM